MESAELKKPKRIKRCYKRSELYHRFIHSDEYAYSPSGTYQLSCRDNYLITGDIGRYKSIDDYWFNINSRIVAIINRANKRILINSNMNYYIWELRRALPDDYEIYYTIEKSLDNDAIFVKEKYLKHHCAYLVKQCTTYFNSFYAVLNDKIRNLYIDINEIPSFYSVKELIDFVKKYKIKKYNFYNEFLIKELELVYYKGYNPIKLYVCPPTLKQIVTGKIFNKKDTLKLQQSHFYTHHCYGYGIPFKDVIKNWNKTDWSRKLANKYNRTNVCVELLDDTNITWNEWVKKTTNAILKNFEIEEKRCIEKSDKNREEALKLLKNSVNHSESIINWREGKRFHVGTMSVSYRCYRKSKHRNKLGTWINEKVFNYFNFDNIQLRKIENSYGISIETSNHAIVPLDDAIRCWKLFTKLKSQFEITNKTCDAVYRLEDKNIKVGIYNLRSIKYCDKVTNLNKPLNRKDWVIIIGCHHIWLEEILDFIKYYHLEKEFNL